MLKSVVCLCMECDGCCVFCLYCDAWSCICCSYMGSMSVLYVGFGYKVRPTTFGCIAMASAVLFILRSRLLLCSAGSGVTE